jgi:transposase-like protein
MQLKNNPLKRRKYDRTGGPAHFKADVLKMIANGQSVAYVAQALGLSEALVYNRDGGPLEATGKRARKPLSFKSSFGCSA